MKLKLFLIFLFSTVTSVVIYGGQDKSLVGPVVQEDTTKLQKSRGVQPRGALDNKFEEGMDSKEDVFFSNAKMYVNTNPTDGNEPTMLILGTAKYANDAQIIQKGISALTGDIVSVKYGVGPVLNPTVRPSELFMSSDGKISFIGQWNKQEIRREDYSVTEGTTTTEYKALPTNKLAYAAYVLNFPTIVVDKEKMENLAGTKSVPANDATKGAYKIKEMGMVSVATNVAISVDELNTLNGNRFSVDVKSAGLDEYDPAHESTTPIDYYRLNYGYADIGKHTTAAAGVHPGHDEVNMQLYSYTSSSDDAQSDSKVKATNSVNVGTNLQATFMRGITSPFEKMRADYMFYHVLTEPGSFGSVTSGRGPVADPRTLIEPGKGYFHAMDVSREYFDKINSNWEHENNGGKKRARGGYYLSRFVQHYENNPKVGVNPTPNGMSLYSFDLADDKVLPDIKTAPYEEQRFNTGKVSVMLQSTHINVLANPYMTPISLTGLLAKRNTGDTGWELPSSSLATDPTATTPFVPSRNVGNSDMDNPKLKAVHRPSAAEISAAATGKYALVRAAYWIVNSAFVVNAKKNGNPVYAYNVKYDFINPGTSSPTMTVIEDKYIEPMQMFLLQAAYPTSPSDEISFEFTPAMKTISGQPFTSLAEYAASNPVPPLPPELASTRGIKSKDSEETVVGEDEIPRFDIKDWFIVEAIAGDSELTADRTAVRFFNTATLGYESAHDEKKQLTVDNNTVKSGVKSSLSTRLGTSIEDAFTPNNVVYTATPQGEALLSNAINYSTKEIPLHYIPSEKEENVTFTVYGLENLDQVKGVWLIDKEKDNYKQDLLSDNSYTFGAKPSDNPLDADNRFILRFYDDEDIDIDGPVAEKPISTYYSGSTLYIAGLNADDKGSMVQIFDMQGRMMGNTVVNNYPNMEYQRPLGQGTFIVKISGKRNYTSKFVNIQNY